MPSSAPEAWVKLQSWFAAIWYVVNQKQGVSALGLQRVLAFGSYQTAWARLHKLRRIKDDRREDLDEVGDELAVAPVAAVAVPVGVAVGSGADPG